MIHNFFKPKLVCALVGMFCMTLAGSPAWGDDAVTTANAPAKKVSRHSKAGKDRKIASLAPSDLQSDAPMGQGEEMLGSLTDTSPRFLSPTKSTGNVRLTGVCRDPNGLNYMSSADQGYANCLDNQADNAGKLGDYLGAQRQAGVGILVGQ